MALKRGIEAAVKAVSDQLLESARPVETKADIAAVATISAQDPEIGDLIAEAFDKVGKDGVITVEESNTTGVELEFTEGMQFDKGYLSPVLGDRPRAHGGRPRGPVHPAPPGQDLARSPTCCRCWRRSSRPASRC